MTASTGILRSKPRYQSTDTAHTSPSDGPSSEAPQPSPLSAPIKIKERMIGDDGAPPIIISSPSHNNRTVVPMVVPNKRSSSSKQQQQQQKSPRSLADLVKSSVELQTEASGLIMTNKNERGTVISHTHKALSSSNNKINQPPIPSNGRKNHLQSTIQHQQQQEEEEVEGGGMAILQMSKEGMIYLKDPTTIESKAKDDTSNISSDKTNGTDDVVIIDPDENSAVIAVGVMGEDGQQVRFCEYDNTKEIMDGGTESGATTATATTTTTSSRRRLDQVLGVEHYDDTLDLINENNEGRNDTDGSNHNNNNNENESDSEEEEDDEGDEEILRELGLEELMTTTVSGHGDDVLEEDEMELLNEGGIAEESNSSEELRSFRVFWELLARWATPATIQLVLGYQGKDSMSPTPSTTTTGSFKAEEKSNNNNNNNSDEPISRNAVDIGASRLASIMSMLKMNISRSLSELKKMQATSTTKEAMDKRQVELRLANLVRTFDSSAPAANLNMKMWRGLTTILIAIVSYFPSTKEDVLLSGDNEGGSELPLSIKCLQMTAVEFRYLTQSAITSLDGAA